MPPGNESSHLPTTISDPDLTDKFGAKPHGSTAPSINATG